ncbi:hypothetical protein [Pseudooceanicola sp.]
MTRGRDAVDAIFRKRVDSIDVAVHAMDRRFSASVLPSGRS